MTDHRDEVAAVRRQINDLLATVQETDEKIAVIEGRQKAVDEVQAKTNLISNLLEDVTVNLETLGEQKSVIDHLTEKLARVDFTMQEAQNTLQTLKHERELTERWSRASNSFGEPRRPTPHANRRPPSLQPPAVGQ